MNREAYLHIFRTYGRSKGVWFAVFTECVRTVLTRIIGLVIVAGMAAAITSGDFSSAERLIWAFVITSVIAAIAGSLGDLVGIRAENNIYSEQAELYYKKLTNKDMSFYRDQQTGYLTTMFRQYLDSALLLTRMYRTDYIRTFISLVAPVIVLFFYSFPIGLLTALIVIVQAVYIVWASTKADKYRHESNEIHRRMSGEVADDIANIVAYKAAGQEKNALKKIKELRARETESFWMRRKVGVLLDLPRNLITTALVAGAFFIVIGDRSPANQLVELLILTLTYIFQILRTVNDLPDLITRNDDLISKIGPTLKTIGSSYETIRDPAHVDEQAITKGRITIQNVDFHYGDDTRAIFKDLTFSIEAGERIGIVGLSGAGKSTLASLLMRFDEVTSGSILIDGIDIRTIKQSHLRQKIAYVPQEPILFHRSIKENIAYHNHTANELEIIRAAKAAHADEFIRELPQGYDTIVGERGVKLSGGQKQRIVIARAVLKNAPILLLDEATSALDSHSEHIIQQALPTIIKGHTAIIIAHRLSTVAQLDRIIVMHRGNIEEQGTHNELLALKGRYYQLWMKQTTQS